MRQSIELDNIFNECLERLLRGETIEQCLTHYPDYASELKPLLETALSIQKATAIQPRPEFRENARIQFQAALNKIESKPRRSFFSQLQQPQWAAVTAAALLLLLAGGTAAAANGSMPDEPLYGIKLTTERIRLSLTTSSLGKAELYTSLVERRMTEISQMANENKPDKIEQVVALLDTSLTQISALSSPQGVSDMKAMSPARETAAPVIAPTAPPQAATALPGAATTNVTPPPAAGLAPVSPPITAPVPTPEKGVAVEQTPTISAFTGDRRAQLRAKIAEDAFNNLALLRELLKTAPESTKLALMQAIAVAEEGYAKALEALN
ncbi:MAG: DUF5667 domain-containing protein [Dehalococcoidales bacterium]|nr:DUF5667 domain-containing protein [Dehalococcoidales bacterium]